MARDLTNPQYSLTGLFLLTMKYVLMAALVPAAIWFSYCDEIKPCLAKLSQNFEDLQTLAGLVIALPSFTFWCLFVFRYLRLIVHLISFWCFYSPTPIPAQPTILPRDCSVILPTVDPENADFKECIESCLTNYPGEIIIVNVGRNMAALTNQIVGPYRTLYPHTNIQVHFTDVANKRIQVAHGVGFTQGKVAILLDDHVFWRSSRFLPTILAPFENDKVGAVGTNKRVRRTDTGFNMRSFWNMIGALYLERHNFEIRATNAVDGGVFVISGRTAAYRTEILKSPGFMAAFTNERFFFNRFGPLNADDDNFLTRQVVARGYDIKIQYSNDALIETTLGTYPKFLSQCLRWVRTTWRSNSASLFTDRSVWRRQPWCVYAVYLTSFVNFALFYDAALIYTLGMWAGETEIRALLAWIFVTKMVKLTPYFLREPQDLLMLPGYFAFAYFHSLIKLYAGVTFWVTAWGGRNLAAINQNNGDDGNSDGGSDSHHNLSSDMLTTAPAVDSPRPPLWAASSSSSSSSPGPGGDGTRMTTPSNVINTPWGSVRTSDPTATPANVLESQLVGQTRRATRASAPSSFTNYRDSGSVSPTTPVASASSSSSYTPSDSSSSSDSSDAPTAVQRAMQPSRFNINSITPAASVPSHSQPPPSSSASTNSCTPLLTWSSESSSSRSDSLDTPITITGRPTLCPDTNMKYSFDPVFAKPLPLPKPRKSRGALDFIMAQERRALGIPDEYEKNWVRGKQCQCLHSDRDGLFKTRSCRCLVNGLFDLDAEVVAGRSRF